MITPETLFIIGIGFVMGAALGSFAKAIADRSIRQETYTGRSYCQSCRKTLKWYDLFPILSFLFLKGRCRYCGKNIPVENFITELVVGVCGSLLFITTVPANLLILPGSSWEITWVLSSLIFKLFAITVLTIVFIVDLKTYLILDRIVIPAAAIAAIYLFISSGIRSVMFYKSILETPFGKYLLPPYSAYFNDNFWRIWSMTFESVLSGLVIALMFALIIVMTKGRGMGWGDVKYVFLLGLILGYPNVIVGVFLAFLLGAITAVGLVMLGRKQFGQTIPFGPFLSLGAVIALIWGQKLIDLYLTLALI